MKKHRVTFAFLSGAIVVAVLCAGQSLAAPAGQEEPPQPPVASFAILDHWAASAHANANAPAFTLWNEASPPRIPAECAKCHSGAGFQDALGADGTPPGQMDGSHATGSTITCKSCHSDATLAKNSVLVASGAELRDLDGSAICIECHQGLGAGAAIASVLEASGASADEVNLALTYDGYHADAGITISFGMLAGGGFEYAGQQYDTFATHVAGYENCVECHDPHSLAVDLNACTECHPGVTSMADLRAIRMDGSRRDYNGNGDVTEGIYYELAGLEEFLLSLIQRYADEIAKTPLVYSADHHPYFFNDLNRNGAADANELKPSNQFTGWTPRLLQAAYNYRTAQANPGAYVHGGKYVIQLLYDSIVSLNQALATPEDLSALHRIDAGHFAGSKPAFRYWDEREAVPGACAKCHTAEGLPFYLKQTVNVLTPHSNGLQCTTCHDSLADYTLRATDAVRFPSGVTVDSGDPGVNLCLNCHQGRESTVGLDRIIGNAKPDEQAAGLRFPDVHYFAASSTRWGSEVKGGYEYTGKEYTDKEYAGFFPHGFGELDMCTDCHDVHSLEIKVNTCIACHVEMLPNRDVRAIRYAPAIDYDGDGDTKEGIYYEITTLQEKLYAAIQRYARTVVGQPIAHQLTGYPYFFVIDRNNNGKADEVESKATNAYKAWTPRLLRAAYNYQNSMADPGAFAHNAPYIIQTLYDSIEDLGEDVSKLIRP